MALSKYKLGELIEQCDQRNFDNEYILDDVRGISTGKEFISTKANMDGVSLLTYKVVAQREFAYVADTSRRGEKIAIAFNTGDKPILISSIYTVFRVSQNENLVSDYLFMFFNRPEFDRYARFNSWGSARETFDVRFENSHTRTCFSVLLNCNRKAGAFCIADLPGKF